MWIYICLAYFVFISLVVIVAICVDDIRSVQQHKKAKRHPYASWLRRRPHLTIYVVGRSKTGRAVTVKSIQKTRYRHRTIITSLQAPIRITAEHTVIIPAGNSVSHAQLIKAAQCFTHSPLLVYRVMPQLRTITAVQDMLFNYRSIIQSVTIKAQNGIYTVVPYKKIIPVFIFATSIATSVLLSGVIIYATYLAIPLHQPALLLAIIGAGIIYCLTAVCADTQLDAKSKLYYCLLSPVSYGFFYISAVLAAAMTIPSFINLRFVKTSGEYD